MGLELYKHFRYEMALGRDIPLPPPKLNVFPHSQFSLQQFLFTACKENVGALGKQEGKWEINPEVDAKTKLSSRPDFTQLLDYAEKLGIIEAKSSGDGDFVTYQLSQAYWDKFDKYAP